MCIRDRSKTRARSRYGLETSGLSREERRPVFTSTSYTRSFSSSRNVIPARFLSINSGVGRFRAPLRFSRTSAAQSGVAQPARMDSATQVGAKTQIESTRHKAALFNADGQGCLGILTLLPLHHNLPLLVALALEADFHVALLLEAGGLLSPLQQHQVAGLGEEFVEAQRVELARRVDAVEVDVEQVHLGAAILVDEGERRAGDIVLRSGVETFGDAFHQRGLAGAEIAAQDDHTRSLQRGRQFPAQRHGFFGRVRDVLVGVHRGTKANFSRTGFLFAVQAGIEGDGSITSDQWPVGSFAMKIVDDPPFFFPTLSQKRRKDGAPREEREANTPLIPRCASCSPSPTARRGERLPAEPRADRWLPANVRPSSPQPRPRRAHAYKPPRRRPAECCSASVQSLPPSCRSGYRQCRRLPCRDCRWD